MGEAIGGILPLALGVALSPVPIIAVIVMLMAHNARTLSTGFLTGWVTANFLLIGLLTALSSLLPADDGAGPSTTTGVIMIVLGLILLYLAIQQWRNRPGPGEKAPEPAWMAAIDTFTFGKAFGMAIALGIVNPKNIILSIGAATTISTAGLTLGGDIVVVLVYLLVATCSVTIPVIAYLFASDRLRAPLERLRDWLTQENATIMFILFLLLGVSMLSNGLKAF